MFYKSTTALVSALRLLFRSWLTVFLMTTVYAGLLGAAYLFVNTREATLPQLILTLALIVVMPTLFFALQAATVNYTSSPGPRVLLKKSARDCLKLVFVSLPVIAFLLLSLYGLGKLQPQVVVENNSLQGLGQLATQPATKSVKLLTSVRYLLVGLIAPLLSIQLWIAASNWGLLPLLKRIRQVLGSAFAPQSLIVYAFGFLVFAVGPYFVLFAVIPTHRVWLEVSLLVGRLLLSAGLILIGWVTTVGALTILNQSESATPKA